jgi:hypothetical protein
MAEEKTPVELKKELQAEVADKYNLKIIRAGLYKFSKFGQVDLRKIDLKKADALVKDGFPYLELKPIAKTESPEEELTDLPTPKKTTKSTKK